jgi:hypothetical protein
MLLVKSLLKKTAILFSIWFFCQIALVACCPESEEEYIEISTLTLKNLSKDDMAVEISAVSADKYRMVLEAQVQFIASNTHASSFLNTAYALSCGDSGVGRSGMKNKIVSLTITADKYFQGYAPGTELNPLFNSYLYEYPQSTDNDPKPVEEIMDSLNENGYRYRWFMALKDKSTKQDVVAFTITIKLANGSQLTQTTNPVQLI